MSYYVVSSMKGVFICVTVDVIEVVEIDQVCVLAQVIDLADLVLVVETDQTAVAEDQVAAIEVAREANDVTTELQELGRPKAIVGNFR